MSTIIILKNRISHGPGLIINNYVANKISSNGNGSTLVSINPAALSRPPLVMRWVTVHGFESC